MLFIFLHLYARIGDIVGSLWHGDGKELDRLETALEAAGVAWWWMELPSGVVFFSSNKTRMLGWSDKTFVHYNDFVKLVHPEDQAAIMQNMRDHIAGKTDLYAVTYRIKKKDGTYVQFYDRGKIVAKKGGEITLAGIVIDTSTIDLAQMQLRELI